MGGKEDHDGTDHEILNFEGKDYISSFDKIDTAKFHALFHQLGSDPKVNIITKLVEQHNTTLSQTNRNLREEKEAHQRTLALLEEKKEELAKTNLELEKINLALTVLAKKKEDEIKDLEEKMLRNIQKLVDPVIRRLQNSGLNGNQKKWLSELVSTLNNITPLLSRRLASHYYLLTPSEIKVAGYIELDKTNKEIAELLGISCRTVEVHRSNIRKKMGIKKRNVNLRTHLLSLK